VERGYGEGKPPSVLLEGIPEHRQMFQLDVGSFGSKQNFNIFKYFMIYCIWLKANVLGTSLALF